MTALRTWHTASPSQVGRRVEPMDREDARFWRIRSERKEQERADEQRTVY